MTDRPSDPHDVEIRDSVPSGLAVSSDQPYRILVVADLAGSASGSVSGPVHDGVVGLSADSFDDVMAAAQPSVTLKMTDPLSSAGAMVEVSLRFDSLKGFNPSAVAEQIPSVQALTKARAMIVERMRGKTSSQALAEGIAAVVAADAELTWLTESLHWSPSAPAPTSDAAEDLLGQIDFGDGDAEESAAPPKSPIGAAVAAAAGGAGSISANEASAMRRTLGEIDRRVSTWLTAVLHAPEVQGIERSWRSLAFLVSHVDFRRGIRLSVMHAPATALLERFTSLLIDPVFDEGADAPNLIVVDSQFGNSAPDLEALDELAQHGASLPALVLAGVSAPFFGVKHVWQMTTLPAVPNLMDQWQFAKYKTLRGQPYATALSVVFGRGLLRSLHGRDKVADLEFAFREACTTERDLVWAGGPIVAACAIADSVARTGWPTTFSGMVHGRVEGFKTAEGGKKGDKKFGPSDTTLAQAKIEELGMAGINAAVGVADHEDVLVWNGMTVARARRNDPAALFEVSMPYQLFAGRLSALLFALKPSLSGKGGEEVTALVTKHMRDWVPFEEEPSAEQLSVQTQPSADHPEVLDLAVTVVPPSSLLPGGVPVVMGYRLG